MPYLPVQACDRRLTAMVESGIWGHAYADGIFVAQGGPSQSALPLGGLSHVHRLYVYLNSDAVLIINGCPLPMRVTRQGYWELCADMAVKSLALKVEGDAARGKYCVLGTR